MTRKQTAAEKLDHTPLTFGQYRGKTPAEIAEENPGYIKWMYETVKNKSTCSQALYKDCAAEVSAIREHDDEEEQLAAAAYGYLGQN
jgi:hypothetical protein